MKVMREAETLPELSVVAVSETTSSHFLDRHAGRFGRHLGDHGVRALPHFRRGVMHHHLLDLGCRRAARRSP